MSKDIPSHFSSVGNLSFLPLLFQLYSIKGKQAAGAWTLHALHNPLVISQQSTQHYPLGVFASTITLHHSV